MHMIFPAHGGPFQPYPLSFFGYHPDPRLPFETLLRRIEPFQPTTVSGQVWLCAYKMRTALWQTPVTISVSPRQVVPTASSRTPLLTFSEQTESALCQNGLTIIYFLESLTYTLIHTMTSIIPGASWSHLMEVRYMRAAISGTKATQCLMDAQRNSTKIWQPPYVISPTPPHVPHMTLFLHTLIKILTLFQTSWALHRKPPRLSLMGLLSHILALSGTSTSVWSPFQRKRSSSISTQSRNGRESQHTHWLRYRSYTVRYYMLPWLLLPDAHTLPIWKPCFQDSITVLLCHTPHPTILLKTSNGGQNASNAQPSPEASLAHYLLQTSTLSQMPAQVSVSASQSETNGAPGAYSQAGNPMGGILAGPKPSDSSSSVSSSYHPAAVALTSRFMGTTKELSKDGGKDVVRTSKQTLSFGVSTLFSTLGNAPSTPGMSPARTTQLTIRLEESTCPLHVSCPTYPSPQSYVPLSQTSTLSSPLQALISTSHHPPCPSPAEHFQTTSTSQSMLSLTIGGRSSSHAPPTVSQER